MALDRSGPQAVVDIGTNTVVLFVPPDAQYGLPPVEVERFVRLGEELAATGRIGPAALGRLGEALDVFRALLDDRRVTAVRVIGTSACRDAGNVAEVAAVVRTTLSTELEIISGEEEAALSFLATKQALAPHTIESNSGIVVVDIGGGSTEIVSGPAFPLVAGPSQMVSLDLGSVRCSERFIGTNARPVDDESLLLMRAFVRGELGRVDKVLERQANAAERLVFVDGIATVLNRLCATEPIVSGTTREIAKTDLNDLFKRVASMPVDELIMLAPDCLSGRADVLPAAFVILLEVMNWAGSGTCTVAETSVRHGVFVGRNEAGTQG